MFNVADDFNLGTVAEENEQGREMADLIGVTSHEPSDDPSEPYLSTDEWDDAWRFLCEAVEPNCGCNEGEHFLEVVSGPCDRCTKSNFPFPTGQDIWKWKHLFK